MSQFQQLRTRLTSTLNLNLNGQRRSRNATNSLTTQFSTFWIYCNEIFLLYKPIASEFITIACNNIFVGAITPFLLLFQRFFPL